MEIAVQNNRGQKIAKIGSSVYVLVFVILMFALRCNEPEPPFMNEGVVVNLGVVESGMTDNIPEAVEQEEQPEPEVQEENVEEIVEEQVVEESVTQDVVETEVTASEEVATPSEVAEPVNDPTPTPTPEPEPEPEPEPTVNENAMFPSNNNNPNQGNQNTPGDQGNPEGELESDIYGDITGPGSGDSGKGWGLNGRSLKELPQPDNDSQEYGRVTIKIFVGRDGKVKNAQFTSKGSTTTDTYLVNLSTKEAYKVRFNADSNAPETQIGFVTFIYTP